MVTNRLLSAQQTARLGTWNERSLRGLSKTQQLVMEMEHHKVSVLVVTKTHIPDSGEMVLDESKGYTMVFSGRQYGSTREGVGLALAPHAKASLRCYQAMSSRILTGEFLTKVGPLLLVVVYAPQINLALRARTYSTRIWKVSRPTQMG